jgi:hypothetical protein
MPHYLLTEAGFSANWRGWVASEAFEYSPEHTSFPAKARLGGAGRKAASGSAVRVSGDHQRFHFELERGA